MLNRIKRSFGIVSTLRNTYHEEHCNESANAQHLIIIPNTQSYKEAEVGIDNPRMLRATP